MRVSPFTAASATAAFLITIIAGAGQAQTAMDALKNKPGSVGLQPTQANSDKHARQEAERKDSPRSLNVTGNADSKNGGASGDTGAAGETGSSKPSHSALGGTAQRAGKDSNSHADTSGQGSAKANSRNSTNSNGTQGRSNMTH
ncbi:hypothetical protein [Pseudoduganella armeniaca]|uniref:Uncharacterized protein n=1 Tax=Pseudoduganella armeniaca TaxID=2072590 RepID=A0A2R4CE57_9BURK|nr:hypothetical protein [Pseudoduganella armeniaca]AVR97919.1 hypothetical protein C9I28_21455 [Pseudoduganella armeniaca]